MRAGSALKVTSRPSMSFMVRNSWAGRNGGKRERRSQRGHSRKKARHDVFLLVLHGNERSRVKGGGVSDYTSERGNRARFPVASGRRLAIFPLPRGFQRKVFRMRQTSPGRVFGLTMHKRNTNFPRQVVGWQNISPLRQRASHQARISSGDIPGRENKTTDRSGGTVNSRKSDASIFCATSAAESRIFCTAAAYRFVPVNRQRKPKSHPARAAAQMNRVFGRVPLGTVVG